MKKKTKLYFLSPNYRSFGNAAEEIYFAILKASRDGCKVVLLIPNFFFLNKSIKSNKELYLLDHPLLLNKNSFLNVSLSLVWFFYAVLLYMWSLFLDKISPIFTDDDKIISRYSVPAIGKLGLWKSKYDLFLNTEELSKFWIQNYSNFSPPRISEDKLMYAENKKSMLFGKKDAWFVSLHVPDSLIESNIRQADIKNYIKAIEYITSKGGYVVRLGDSTMPKLPKLRHVIDYAHFENQSEIMNLYFLSKSIFLLGASSGPTTVAKLLGNKVIAANRTHFIQDPFVDLSIQKQVFRKIDNSKLSLKEVNDIGADTQFFENRDSEVFFLKENSPEEILNLVKEALQFDLKKPTDLQISFNKHLRRSALNMFMKEDFPRHYDGIRKEDMADYKVRAFIESPLCYRNNYIADFFIKENM